MYAEYRRERLPTFLFVPLNYRPTIIYAKYSSE
jgi:hypothetical protein